MKWNNLSKEETLEEIKKISEDKKVLIFKHSTRCPISSMALSRLESKWKNDETENIEAYFLDLIRYRNISNRVAEEFGIQHQSPQVLIINQGSCVYDNSHSGINYQEILDNVSTIS